MSRRAVLFCCGVAISAAAGFAVSTADSPAPPEPGWHDSGGGFGLDGLSCATATWCVGLQSLGGQNAATTWTGHKWTAAVSIPPYEDYVALSCPTVDSCLALTSNGGTLRLAHGTWQRGGAYDPKVVGPAYRSPGAALFCSSINECVAVNGAGDEVTLGPDGWKRPEAIDDAPLTDVACPTPASCVATDGEGRVLQSVAGRFGSPRDVAPDGLQAVACASADFCAVADLDGQVRVGDPDRLGPPSRLGPAGEPIALACPSHGVCIAAGPDGAITVLSRGRWHAVTAARDPNPVQAEAAAISCPAGATDFCAIAGAFNDVQLGGAPFT